MNYKGKYNMKLFYIFLNEENILKQYIDNIESFRAKTFRQNFLIHLVESYQFISYYSNKFPNLLFINAFLWEETKEGHEWWKNYSQKWLKYYTENNLEKI